MLRNEYLAAIKFIPSLVDYLVQRKVQNLDLLIHIKEKSERINSDTSDLELKNFYNSYCKQIKALHARVPILYFTAIDGEPKLVQHLILLGLDANQLTENGSLPLGIAVMFADDEKYMAIVKILFEAGATPHRVDWLAQSSALSAVVSRGSIKALEYFISADVNLDTENELGEIPLHLAAKHGRIKIAEMLLEGGASVNKKDRFGNMPLHCLQNSSGYRQFMHNDEAIKLAELLLRHGADVNGLNEVGRTPMFDAIRTLSFDKAKLYIEAGADLNKADMFGETPVSYLKKSGSIESVRLTEVMINLMSRQFVLLFEEALRSKSQLSPQFIKTWSYFNDCLSSLRSVEHVLYFAQSGFEDLEPLKCIEKRLEAFNECCPPESEIIKLSEDLKNFVNNDMYRSTGGKTLMGHMLGIVSPVDRMFAVQCLINAKHHVLTESDKSLFREAYWTKDDYIHEWFIKGESSSSAVQLPSTKQDEPSSSHSRFGSVFSRKQNMVAPPPASSSTVQLPVLPPAKQDEPTPSHSRSGVFFLKNKIKVGPLPVSNSNDSSSSSKKGLLI